jgi:hypothetical protein
MTHKEKKRAYDMAYRSANRPKLLAQMKAYREANLGRVKALSKAYREANPEKVAAQKKAWCETNRAKLSAIRKARYALNSEEILARKRFHYAADPEKTQARNRAWHTANPEKVLAYRREYYRQRLVGDPEFRLLKNLRTRINMAIHQGSRSARTRDILGCTIPELRAHLEKQFRQGMTWENYGPVWHVDHIKPCAKFDLLDPAQQQECFHYTNLQPLFAEENLRKGARV